MNNQRKYPYDDKIMVYDYDAHRYVLTNAGVLSELGINLDMSLDASGDADITTLAKRFLKRISSIVYSWIYRDIANEDWIEYLLATYPPLRDWVKEMLQAQLQYTLANGDIGLYSGVNIAKGQSMDIRALRDVARVAPEVEDYGYRTISGLPYCLKYAGFLPRLQCACYRVGY